MMFVILKYWARTVLVVKLNYVIEYTLVVIIESSIVCRSETQSFVIYIATCVFLSNIDANSVYSLIVCRSTSQNVISAVEFPSIYHK